MSTTKNDNVAKAKEELNKELGGVNPSKKKELLDKALGKKEEVTEKALLGSSWWIPNQSDVLVEDNSKEDKQLIYKEDITEEEIQEELVKIMIPQEIKYHEKNPYKDKNDQYLLEYVNFETGEIETTPIVGNLHSKLAKLLVQKGIDKDYFRIPGNTFEKIPFQERVLVVRYCGLLYQESEETSYHTFTGEKVE